MYGVKDKMKLKLLLTVVLLAVMSISAPVFAAECKLVKYSSHENYPPFHWYHKGQFFGVTHDITKHLLQSYGVDYQVQFPEPWKRVLLNAQRGKVDLVLGLKKVAERQTYLSFTDTPLLNNPVSIFVKKGKEFEFTGWRSLINRTGNMNLGDRHGNEFDNFAKNNLMIQRVKGLGANFDMLKMNRTDYFITGFYTGMGYLQSHGLTDQIQALSPHLLDGLIHFGFVKSSPCLVLKERFDADLRRLMHSSEFDRMLQHNIQLWHQHQTPHLHVTN